MIRIATFNLENLLTRPSAMQQERAEQGRKALEDHATANAIAGKARYSQADKTRLVELSKTYGWHQANPPRNALVFIRSIRGRLFRIRQDQIEVIADGRDSRGMASSPQSGNRPALRGIKLSGDCA